MVAKSVQRHGPWSFFWQAWDRLGKGFNYWRAGFWSSTVKAECHKDAQILPHAYRIGSGPARRTQSWTLMMRGAAGKER